MFILPAPDSVAFSLCGVQIFWYGIIMATAIFAAVCLANYLLNTYYPEFKKDSILSVAPIMIILGIIGARSYFCLLNYNYYFLHPLEILNIREGGLSIHGALFAGILTLIVWARLNKISPLKVFDVLACATFLGQAIGRWGNYFNSEAYGFPVAGQNFGVYIPPAKRLAQYYSYNLFHPTFLYESLLDLIGFIVLFFILKKFGKKYAGLTFFTYFVLYALIRIGVEQIRLDSALNLGTIPFAQVVSAVMFVIGLVGIAVTLKR